MLFQFVSEVVAATAGLKPARAVYRRYYDQAIRSFAHRCQALDDVRAVFVRGSVARGNWIPGISDIDVAVVFVGRIIPPQSLARFWQTLEQIKRYYPLFEQALVFSEAGFDEWCRSGDYRAYEQREWMQVAGAPLNAPTYQHRDLKFKLDLLFEVYQAYLLLCRKQDGRSTGHRQRYALARAIAKTKKYGEMLAERLGTAPPTWALDPAETPLAQVDWLCRALLADIPEPLRAAPFGSFEKASTSAGIEVEISLDAVHDAMTVLVDSPDARLVEAVARDQGLAARRGARRLVVFTKSMETAFRVFWPSAVIRYFVAEPSAESELLLNECLSRRLTNLPLLAGESRLRKLSPSYAVRSVLRLVAAKTCAIDATTDAELARALPRSEAGLLAHLDEGKRSKSAESADRPAADWFVPLQQLIISSMQTSRYPEPSPQ